MTPNKNTEIRKKIKEIWAKIQTDYEDELEEGISETMQLFYTKMEEIIPFDCPHHMSSCVCHTEIEEQMRSKLSELVK